MDDGIRLSVVVPAHDEQETIERLVEELDGALERLAVASEIIVVDDASADGTAVTLRRLMPRFERLRVLALPRQADGSGHGQSAAFWWGFRAARGVLIASLDADLQNDPADLEPMLARQAGTGADLVQGDRTRTRCDPPMKKLASRVGRLFRRMMLGDTVRDTGCSLRVMRREVALALPLGYRGMHRFIPGCARELGFTVEQVPVRHRPRGGGASKYGILDRAWSGFVDLLAVRWMRSRRCRVEPTELVLADPDPASVVEPSCAPTGPRSG